VLVTDEILIPLLRATARTTAFLFILAFIGEASFALRPSRATRWLRGRRAPLTLGLAGTHTIHLAGIITLAATHGSARFLDETPKWVIVLGALVYLIIYALALSETKWSPAWLADPRVRCAATWIVGGALARPFVMKAVLTPSPFYALASALFGMALVVRVAGAGRRPRRRSMVAQLQR
jgi:hypothetical protein